MGIQSIKNADILFLHESIERQVLANLGRCLLQKANEATDTKQGDTQVIEGK
jgi:hypothetical protein